MFQAFALDTMWFRQTSKQQIIITTYKDFPGTYVESKKHYICSIINKQRFYKLTVLPHLALLHVKETIPGMYSSFPNNFQRTNVKLKIT